MPVKGKPKPLGHWTEKVLRITQRCPLAGLKADLVANQGSVREKAILGNGVVHVCFHPKDPNDASKGVCGWTWSTPVKPTKSRMLSLSPLRTLLPRVMTSNRARYDRPLTTKGHHGPPNGSAPPNEWAPFDQPG